MRRVVSTRLRTASVVVAVVATGAVAPTVFAAPVSAATPTTYAATGSVGVGTSPFGVAVDPSTQTIYVVNSGSRTVSVVDASTHTVTATIAVGTNPTRVAVDASTRTVYVTNTGGNSVSVINGTTNTVTATVPVGNSPVGVAVDPSTHTVYDTNSVSGSVSVVDGTTNVVTATVSVGQSPGGLAVDPSTHTAYVVNSVSNTVSVIRGSSVTATVAVAAGATTATADPSTHVVYVANRTAGTVVTIDGLTNTVTGAIAVGASPNVVAVDPTTHTLYVGSISGARSVSVIDRAGLTATVPLAANPTGLAVDATTHTLYAAASAANTVTEINQGVPVVAGVSPSSAPLFGGDPVTITGANFTGATSVRFGGSAVSFTVDSATQITASSPARPAGPVDVTVTGPSGTSGVTADDRYTVLPAPTTAGPTSYTVTGTATVGAGANGVGVDPSTHTVYVANSGGNSVSVIDGTTNAVKTTVPVGSNPVGVAVDPSTHTVYVTNSNSGTVSVIDGATNTVKATVVVGVRPMGVAVDPSARTVYVANSGTTTVSVVDGRSNTVTRTVTLAASPSGVGVDPSTHTAYVAVPTTGSLAVITGVSGAVTTLALTGSPSVVAVDPTTRAVYVVTDAGGGSVSVVDGPTGAVTGTFAAGGPVAVDPATHTVYAAGGGTTTTVQAVDGANPTATVAIGQVPTGIAVDPTTHTVYAVAAAASRLSVINPGPPAVEGVSPASGLVTGGGPVTIVGANLTGVTSVKFGDRTVPFRIDSARRITVPGFAGAAGQLDVTVSGRGGSSPVTATDRYTVRGSYRPSGGFRSSGAEGVAVDEVTHAVYLTNPAGNSVTVLDGTSRAVTATIAVGATPSAVAVDPSTHTVYVVNKAGNSLSVIDGVSNSVTATVTVGAGPSGVAVDPSTRRVFVANKGAGTVSVIDGRTNVAITAVAVPANPSGVGVDPSTHTVYVGGSSVAVIDEVTNVVTATVPVTTTGTGFDLAVDPSSHVVYAANADRRVTVISGATNTITGTVIAAATGSVNGAAVDPSTHTAYFTNIAGQSVAVVNGLVVTGSAYSEPVGNGPSGVAVDPSTHTVYAAGGGQVRIINAGDTPTLSAVSPASGSVSGGQTVTVTGTNLRYATAVKFGSVAASSFTADSDTQITAVTPAGDSGTVDVTVTTPWGTTATSAADQYTYVTASPAIVTTPSAGTAAGGSISDTAALTGGASPSGTVTFALFGPGDAMCSGTPATTRTIGVSGASAASGDVTVTRAGTYRWTASYSGDGNNTAASSGCGDTTTVTAGALDHLVLSPATSSVAAGGSQVYTAEGFDAYGNDLGDVTGDTTFTIVGGTCTVAACTATAPGDHVVTGTDGSATGTATLTVTAGVLDHLVLSPATSSVVAGGSQVYTAEGFDAYGNDLGDVTGDTTFTVDGGGSCSGAVCTPATTAGAYTVTGTDGTMSATASVTVTPAVADHLVLAPSAARVTAGDAQSYTAVAFDAYGNSRGDVTDDSTFAIDGGGSCTGASCSATTAGRHVVTATAGTLTGMAIQSVAPAALDHLVSSPRTATVTAAGAKAFTVAAYDRYGNFRGNVTGSATFQFGGTGSCTGATCTSTKAGIHNVVARFGGKTVISQLQVVPAALDHVLVTPRNPAVVAGAPTTFVATGYDGYGNSRGPITAGVVFTVDGGSCAASSCTATSAGGHTVTAAVDGKTATAQLRVVAAALDHVVVSPRTATIAVGGARTFAAIGYDRYGNVTGDVTGDTTFAVDGGGSCAGAACGAATPGTYTVTGTYSGASATASLRVVRSAGGRTTNAGD